MNIYWKELIDIIWTIIKISEKKEDVFVYLDLILIINFEKEREREREGGKDRDKNSMCNGKSFLKVFFRTSDNLFNLKIRF